MGIFDLVERLVILISPSLSIIISSYTIYFVVSSAVSLSALFLGVDKDKIEIHNERFVLQLQF